MPEPKTVSVARIALLVVVGVIAAAVIAVAGAATVVPQCGLCHGGADFETATDAAGHAAVDCSNCHSPSGVLSRAAYGFEQVAHVIPNVGVTGRDATSVTDARCLECHANSMTGITSSGGLRILHEECTAGSSCVDCHSTTAHGEQVSWPRTYTMDGCLECHGDTGSLAKCDTCHEERRLEDRLVVGPWAVTHGSNWRQTHGMGDDATCGACHPQGYCDRCHGPGLPHGSQFRTEHPAYSSDPEAQCTSCHQSESFCNDCHGLPMPHPPSFKVEHSDIVETEGRQTCESCHQDTDCVTCHEMHVHPGGAVGRNLPTPLLRGDE